MWEKAALLPIEAPTTSTAREAGHTTCTGRAFILPYSPQHCTLRKRGSDFRARGASTETEVLPFPGGQTAGSVSPAPGSLYGPRELSPAVGHPGRPPREAETSCDISGTVLTRLSLIIRQALHVSSTANLLFKKILGDFRPLVQPRRSLEMVTPPSNWKKLN